MLIHHITVTDQIATVCKQTDGDVGWDEDAQLTEDSLMFILCSLYAAYSSRF